MMKSPEIRKRSPETRKAVIADGDVIKINGHEVVRDPSLESNEPPLEGDGFISLEDLKNKKSA